MCRHCIGQQLALLNAGLVGAAAFAVSAYNGINSWNSMDIGTFLAHAAPGGLNWWDDYISANAALKIHAALGCHPDTFEFHPGLPRHMHMWYGRPAGVFDATMLQPDIRFDGNHTNTGGNLTGDAFLANGLAAIQLHMYRAYVDGPYAESKATAQSRPSPLGGHAPGQFTGPAGGGPNGDVWPSHQKQNHRELKQYILGLHNLFDSALTVLPGSPPHQIGHAMGVAVAAFPADGCICQKHHTPYGDREFWVQFMQRDVGCVSLRADAITRLLHALVPGMSNLGNLSGIAPNDTGRMRSRRQTRGYGSAAAQAAGIALDDLFKHQFYNIIQSESGMFTTYYGFPNIEAALMDELLAILYPFYLPPGQPSTTIPWLIGPSFYFPISQPEYRRKNVKTEAVTMYWLSVQHPEIWCLFWHMCWIDDGFLDFFHMSSCSGRYLRSLRFCFQDLNCGMHRTPAQTLEAARIISNTLNRQVFGPTPSGLEWDADGPNMEPTDGPRFRAVSINGPNAPPVYMSDTNLNDPNGTRGYHIAMYCDDPEIFDRLPDADKDLHARMFMERAIRFLDFIGPCICPAKLYKWCLCLGLAHQYRD